jgi:hypothetical protein
MSELVTRLKTAGQNHKGTDLGALMQWAAIHIESQDEALVDVREELQNEERERLRLETALHTAKAAVEAALSSINAPMCPPVELSRDLAPHINLMAGHGDPDYLKTNGMSIRHIDTRAEPKKTKHKKAAA